MFELDAKSRPDAHTWHLFYFNALLELRHHSRLELLDFVLPLRLKVLHELVARGRKICSCFKLVRVDLALARLTHVDVRAFYKLGVLIMKRIHKVGIARPRQFVVLVELLVAHSHAVYYPTLLKFLIFALKWHFIRLACPFSLSTALVLN